MLKFLFLHKLSEILLEKETVMGAELDDLIVSMRPGIQLPSNKIDTQDSEADEAQEPDQQNSTSPDSSPEKNAADNK